MARHAAAMLGGVGLLLLAAQASAFTSAPRLPLGSAPQRLAMSPALRQSRITSGLTSLNMQEVRGICPICSEPVMSNQPRETDDDGVYFHSACVDAKMLAEGQVRMSERELDQLKAAAAGIAPKAQATQKTQQAPSGGGGGFFGGLFGGKGGGAEVVDLPGAEVVGLPGATPAAAAPAAPVPPPPVPAAPTAWKQATDPTSGAPYWYNEQTGESSWTPPAGVPPIGPPPGAPPAAAGGAGNQILQRLEQQPGTKVVPKPGMAIPFYWQEGIEYGINRRNTFAMNEFVGIRRSDGDIKFGTIMDIAQGREGNVYQVLVDGNGSYQQGKSADSLYKINYDVTSQGFKLELKKQDEAPKGLFGW